MMNKEKRNQFWIFFIILCVLSFLMILLFMPLDKLDTGHDIIFHQRRFIVLVDALKNGHFPIYLDYTSEDGYGYGTRFFYPDLILVPFATIAIFTNFIFAYKLMWFVMTVLCGLLMYKMANKIYRNYLGSIFIALIYTFASYRLQDVYERSAVGEALAFTFIPLVFWGLYEIIKGNYKKWYIITIGFSLLIFCHLISSMLTFISIIPFIIIYYKSLIKEPIRIRYLLFAGITTIALSGYFLFPFIEQLLQTNFHMSNMQYIGYRGYYDTPINRFIKSIFLPHPIYIEYSMTPCLGISMIICIILRLFVRERTKYTNCIDYGIIIGLVYLLLTINIYDWNKYPLKAFNFIQFSWRLFQYCTFFFSIAGGYYLAKIATKNKKIILTSVILITFITCQLFTQSNRYKAISFYYSYFIPTTLQSMSIVNYYKNYPEYFSINFNDDHVTKKGNNIDTETYAKLSNITREDGLISLDVETTNNNKLEFPLTYYKGYTATLNNKKVAVEESKNGLVEVSINNSGKLIVQYTGTFLQRYSLYITLISCVLLIIYIVATNRRKHYDNK